ncbi:MAG: SHOCT domain-containing protein [Planctomycetes bacterium]|nr:SHOCT domain-containing protein [Planctomycetota bacterium]
MSISDEIERLQQLHASGALTDAEFAAAKKLVIDGASRASPLRDERRGRTSAPSDNSLGTAANRYVTYQMVMGVIGLVLFVFVFFSAFKRIM